MALDSQSPAVTAAWTSLRAASPSISFLLLSYARKGVDGVAETTSRATPSLEVLLKGSYEAEGGWNGAKRLMLANEVRFLLLRVCDQYMLVLFFGLSVR
jgi:hypothetical protein